MKNLFKKTLVFVLSAAMALSFSMPAKTKADTYTQTFNVSTQAELTEAADVINADSSETGNYLINITANINNASFSPEKNTTTINGNGFTLQCGNGSEKVILDVVNKGTTGTVVNLYDVTFNGNNTAQECAGLIHLWPGAKVVINDGVTIQNNKTDNYLGGGISNEGGILEMNGGTIRNCGVASGSVCYGGGVAVYSGGTFTMNGGTIDSCYASSEYYSGSAWFNSCGGGVFVTQGSTFTMNDGTISNNDAYYLGGGVAQIISYDELALASYQYGYITSKVSINGGTITGNSAGTAGGGVISSGFYYCNAIPIGTSSPGSGSVSNPGMYIDGATITNNESYEGGGVYTIASRRPTNISNSTISGNYAYLQGAGVENDYYWSVMSIANSTISDNEAETGSGGGVMARRNGGGGSTTISSSTITGNTSGTIGAGVYYDADSRLNITGANEIQNNTYDEKKNNLNILDSSHLVYVTGSLAGSQIGLSDPVLWGDGISDEQATVAAAKLTSGYKTNNASLVPKDAFTSDHNTWYPDYSEDGNEVRLVKKTNNSKIKGGNILVDGLIGVTLWVDLDASTEAEREAYSMQFTLDDHTGAGEVQTADYDKDKTAEGPNGETYYGFTFEDVKAPQMADEITAQLLQDGEAVGVSKEYSVEQYAENMINKASTKQDYKDFLRPMLNYGAFAQKYFDYNKSDLANKNNDMSNTVYEQTVDSKYKISPEGGLDGIAVKYFGMQLNDGVDLHFQFTADSSVNMDEYTAVLNDDPNKEPMFIDDNDQPTHELTMPFTELETQGVKTYYVNVYNIPAHRYDDTMTVTLYKKSDPATTFKIHFSVLSYAYEIIEKNAEVPAGVNEADLKNLLKSMVLYNVWAEKYFNKYPGEYIRTKRVVTEKA